MVFDSHVSRQTAIKIFVGFLGLLFGGVKGYHLIEGRDYFDSLTMTVTSLARETSNYLVEDVPVGKAFDGKTIKESMARLNGDLLIVGHKHEGVISSTRNPHRDCHTGTQ